MGLAYYCTAIVDRGHYCAQRARYFVSYTPGTASVGRVCSHHADHATVDWTAIADPIRQADAAIPSAWLVPLDSPVDDEQDTAELPPTPDTAVPRCSIGHMNHGGDRRARYRVISRGMFRGYVCEFHAINARLTQNQFLMHSPKNELGREFLWAVNCTRCDGLITDVVMRNVCDECDAPAGVAAYTTTTPTDGWRRTGPAVQPSNTTENTASMNTTVETSATPKATPEGRWGVATGTGVATTPPATAPATTLAAVLTADAQDAAWRLAGSQFIKLTRDPLVGLLSRHLGPDDEALRGRIAAFLQTEIGTALLASLLSAGVSTLPASVAGETPQRLARELRVRAMADAGDVVAELLMGPLRQVVSLYLQGVPGANPQTATLEPGGIRPIITVAERVESEVSR